MVFRKPVALRRASGIAEGPPSRAETVIPLERRGSGFTIPVEWPPGGPVSTEGTALSGQNMGAVAGHVRHLAGFRDSASQGS